MPKFIDQFKKSYLVIANDIVKKRSNITKGSFLTIDPGTQSLGYVYCVDGVCVDSGIFKVSPSLDIQSKLGKIRDMISAKWPKVDTLAIEQIRGQMAHQHLIWACGVIVATVSPKTLIQVPPVMWRMTVPKDYKKSDLKDATTISELVLTLCNEAEDVKYKRKKKAPKKDRRLRT